LETSRGSYFLCQKMVMPLLSDVDAVLVSVKQRNSRAIRLIALGCRQRSVSPNKNTIRAGSSLSLRPFFRIFSTRSRVTQLPNRRWPALGYELQRIKVDFSWEGEFDFLVGGLKSPCGKIARGLTQLLRLRTSLKRSNPFMRSKNTIKSNNTSRKAVRRVNVSLVELAQGNHARLIIILADPYPRLTRTC
jgi:hypothetical protein